MTRRAARPATAATRDAARRTWLPLAGLAAALLFVGGAAWWWWATGSAPGASDGPVIIFSIDTLRADRLPAYGYGGVRTPHIDRLAADGVLFERAYAHSPQTLPAHTSMLSGELPFEHGVRDNIGFSLKNDQRLLQHTLKDLGFATAGFVSAYVLRHQTGFNRGFDVYDDALPAASPDLPLGQVQRPGAQTVAAALAWIDRQPSSRFFLFTHIYEPHKPYDPPAQFAASTPYDGEVQHSDAVVGQLLMHLGEKGLYDRATIVLLSDHGEGLGDHGEEEHGIFLYRETIQVPLIVKLPGSRGAGTRVTRAVQQIDLVPTILDLVGAGGTERFKGRSLRPLLEGSGGVANVSIYSESLSPRYHFGWSELYALTDDRYRLIRAPRDELYDIAQDPGERTSIAAERTQVRDAMRGALDRLIENVPIAAPSAVSEEDRRRLAALGYVGTQTGSSPTVPDSGLPDPKDKIDVLRHYKRATELAGQQQFAAAAAIMRDLLQTDPHMTDVWVQLGGIYERLGRSADAVEAYKGGIRSNPQNPSSVLGAAVGLLQLGRLDEARAHAELAIPIAPAGAHELLAQIAVEQGDAATARRHASLAHEADPLLPIPNLVEGLLLYKQGHYAAAVPHFLKARAIVSGRTVKVPHLNYYLADSLGRLERYREAEYYFADELTFFPNNLRARAGQAMLYRATGRDADSEKAIAALLRADTPEAYNLAAQLWTMFGEPEKAAAVKARSRQYPER